MTPPLDTEMDDFDLGDWLHLEFSPINSPPPPEFGSSSLTEHNNLDRMNNDLLDVPAIHSGQEEVVYDTDQQPTWLAQHVNEYRETSTQPIRDSNPKRRLWDTERDIEGVQLKTKLYELRREREAIIQESQMPQTDCTLVVQESRSGQNYSLSSRTVLKTHQSCPYQGISEWSYMPVSS